MREISDDDLRRLRQGEMGGLEAAYRCYGARIHRVCRKMLGDGADADDALQEVFLRLLDQAPKFAGRSRFSTWLYRLAVNHCLNFLKKRGRKVFPSLAEVPESALPPNPHPSPPEIAAREEQRRIADRLLDELGHLDGDARIAESRPEPSPQRPASRDPVDGLLHEAAPYLSGRSMAKQDRQPLEARPEWTVLAQLLTEGERK